MWVTAAISVFNAIGGQEGAASRARAAAIDDARKEQQKVYAMALGVAGLGALGLFLAKR